MAVDKLVDSTQLDADLTSVANAIRAKSGGSGQLAFPSGFVSEIGNIPSGGGNGIVLLASGTYTLATNAASFNIPVNYTGTPAFAIITPVDYSSLPSGNKSTFYLGFLKISDIAFNPAYPNSTGVVYQTKSTGSGAGIMGTTKDIRSDAIVTSNGSNNYKYLAADYKWYIWGYAT